MTADIFDIPARRCKRCGGILTSEQGLRDGYGSCCLKKMKEGDTTMIIFYAKTQMKDRGYSERLEHTGANGEPLLKAAEIDLSKLTDEQRKVLLTIGEQVLNDTEH